MTDTLWSALADSMATIKNPSKDGRGNYGTYLTLDALTAAVRGPLAEHGITFRHDIDTDAEMVLVTCIVTHASGEQFDVGPVAAPRGSNIQHLMGATTYLRRLTLQSALGLAGDDDDDGQQHADQVTGPPVHTKGPRSGPAARAAARSAVEPATDKQLGMLKGVLRKVGVERDQWLVSDKPVKILGHAPSDPLTKGEASALIEAVTLYVSQHPDGTPPSEEDTELAQAEFHAEQDEIDADTTEPEFDR